MNLQELTLRVGELATRIGYPIPAVAWSTSKKQLQREMLLDPNGQFGPTLYVHPDIDRRRPDSVQEFLIAQELVQARLGAHRQRRAIKVLIQVLQFVLAVAVVILMMRLTDSYWIGFIAAVALLWVLFVAATLLVSVIWSGRVVRRSDPQLVEILGRDQVVAALTWYVEFGWRRSWRWVLAGAPPTAQSRLRRLGVSITD